MNVMQKLAVLSCLVLAIASSATAADSVAPPSFLNDVIPVLTRFGCNQGSCHGKNSGQNGFRLSLRGYAPEWDHKWLTREFAARRINRAMPEASLLLQKPLGRAPHQGGRLFDENSPAYDILLDWIRAGTPGPNIADATLVRLEATPASTHVKPGQQQQLLVRAHFSDGAARDVTWLAKFDSSDASTATVSSVGNVHMLRAGEAVVRCSFMGQVALATFTCPHDAAPPAALFTQKNNFIDEHVFKKLADLRIEPSAQCDDATFLRRAFLDTIGVLPQPEEVRAFLADPAQDKRPRMIASLFQRPEFIDFWTLQLADLLQNRKERDHDVRGSKGVRIFHQWLRNQVASNRPWNELAREVIQAAGTTDENPAVGYYIVTVGEQREAHKTPVVASVAQTFLGTRIGCAQCHNHPLEKYTQDDYYHFAGFFSRLNFKRQDSLKGATTLYATLQDLNRNKNPVGVNQPRTNKFLKPRPLDRTEMDFTTDEDPRVRLANWIVDPSNEHFAGAMVNRLWSHFMGVGLVEPIDDLRASNPPTNRALWDALVKEFITHKYDLKHMMHVVLNSRAYQLSSDTRPGNVRDERFYSHYRVRRLSAHVLLDALSQSIGVPEKFAGYPLGMRAVQVADPSSSSYFLSLFGRSERVTACACEANPDVTLPQLLHLLNSSNIFDKIRDGEGRVARLLQAKTGDDDIVTEMYLATLSRLPRPDELELVRGYLQQGKAPSPQPLSPRGRGVGGEGDAFREVVWALLNTREFVFNH